MRRIGLIGGMSWESSIEYERLINQEVRARLGGTASADLLIRSFNFADIERLQQAGDWDQAGRVLAAAAIDLVAAGAQVLVLCTNTMHQVADAITAAVDVPFIHIADATAAAIHRTGIHTVGLLGTRYTMQQPFYRDRLAGHGFDVRTPNAADRAIVHEIIYDELVQGIITDESRDQMLEIAESLLAEGCEGIIAGCTEIELLVTPSDIDVAYFPTTRIHALAAVDAALAEGSRAYAGGREPD
jgi:aspartate racemase